MATTDYRDVLSYYTNFSPPRDIRADQAQGEKDGEFEQPRSDQEELSGYEWKILTQARFDFARFKTLTQIDSRLGAAAAQGRKQQRYEEFGSNIKDLSHRQDAAISAINKEKGANSARARTEDDELLEAQERFDNMRTTLEREPDLHFSNVVQFPLIKLKAYVWLMMLFALVEMIVNPKPFRHAIGNQLELLTYFGVFSFSVGTILSAHFIGLVLRQRKWRTAMGDVMRVKYGVPILLSVVLGSFVLLSWRRFEIEMGLPLSTETNSLGLALVPLVINIVLFVASSAVAFFSHDPHPDFESLLLARNEAVARVAQRRQDYEVEIRDAESRFRRRRQSLGSRAERLQRDIDEKQAEGDALGPREEAELVKVIAVIGQRLLAYQDGNERMRHSNRPAYFGQKTLEIVEDYMRGKLPRLATEDSAAEPLRQYSF